MVLQYGYYIYHIILEIIIELSLATVELISLATVVSFLAIVELISLATARSHILIRDQRPKTEAASSRTDLDDEHDHWSWSQ